MERTFLKMRWVAMVQGNEEKACFDRAWIQQCSLLGLEGMLSSKGGRLMLRLMNEDWTALENLGR